MFDHFGQLKKEVVFCLHQRRCHLPALEIYTGFTILDTDMIYELWEEVKTSRRHSSSHICLSLITVYVVVIELSRWNHVTGYVL